MSNIHFKSNSNEWETPQEFFNLLNEEFHFTLDPCASVENHKCIKYYNITDNGLNQSWKNEIVFMNPPYGREIKHWIKKAYNESYYNNTTVACLIPARTDTSYWHNFIFGKAEIRFIKGRLKFGNSKNSAPFPSALVIFNGREQKGNSTEKWFVC